MFRGRDIAELANVSGLLDRTLWVFKHRFFPYLLICLSTFCLFFLIFVALFVTGYLSLDPENIVGDIGEIEFYMAYLGSVVAAFFLLFGVPTFLSDIAMQYYTSYLVREKEVSWWTAVKKALSTRFLKYILIKMIGYVLLTFTAALSFFVAIIPIIGTLAWYYLNIALFTAFVGLSPAILVEENPGIFTVIGRNIKLVRSALGLSANSSVLGWLIILAIIYSAMGLVGGLGYLIIALIFGQPDIFAGNLEQMQLLSMIFTFAIPLISIVIFIPLQSIFFSLLYYSLRSKSEGFSLENRINIYTAELKEKDQAVSMRTTA